MPTSPPELLALALQLNVADETSRRCAVSRAYYATLHAVDQTFERQPGAARQDGESSHAEIIGRAIAYGNGLNPGRTSAQTIAQVMPRLRRLRNRADYKIADAFDQFDSDGMLARAAKVLEACADVVAKRASAAQSSV